MREAAPALGSRVKQAELLSTLVILMGSLERFLEASQIGQQDRQITLKQMCEPLLANRLSQRHAFLHFMLRRLQVA